MIVWAWNVREQQSVVYLTFAVYYKTRLQMQYIRKIKCFEYYQ